MSESKIELLPLLVFNSFISEYSSIYSLLLSICLCKEAISDLRTIKFFSVYI